MFTHAVHILHARCTSQGDVESIAQKSPADLTKMLEGISGCVPLLHLWLLLSNAHPNAQPPPPPPHQTLQSPGVQHCLYIYVRLPRLTVSDYGVPICRSFRSDEFRDEYDSLKREKSKVSPSSLATPRFGRAWPCACHALARLALGIQGNTPYLYILRCLRVCARV